MITQDLEAAVEHSLEEIFIAGEVGERDILIVRIGEVKNFIRIEAINLAHTIIGKDKILHNVYDSHGEPVLNPQEKAVFDFQVAQRVALASYQKPIERGKPTGPEDLINPELSENEE